MDRLGGNTSVVSEADVWRAPREPVSMKAGIDASMDISLMEY